MAITTAGSPRSATLTTTLSRPLIQIIFRPGGFSQMSWAFFADSDVGYVQAPQAYYNQRASFIATGAAEQTYAYSSCIQMADYAVGYPIIMGCHNTHRTSALRAIGGFAQHDADDLLLTLHYRAAGWRGVYIPVVMARGLTPVDWPGYLAQQRRWARSVLDVKFRIYPRLAERLPFVPRSIGYVHGLYWVQGLSPLVGTLLLAAMLVTPSTLRVIAPPLAPRLAVLAGSLALANAYRQYFFLGKRQEWGFHWRVLLLEWAKWLSTVAAIMDLVRHRSPEYDVTAKTTNGPRPRVLALPHGLATVAVVLAWCLGAALGIDAGTPVHVAAIAFVIASAGLVASEYLPFPEPYDPALAETVD
jgi:cellulose synthase (UDP-forming)